MKRTKVDLDPERQIITHMIVSDQFLREIVPLFRPMYLKTGYAREVSNWILEYWDKYKASPGKDIQSIYQRKKKQIQDEDEADNIAEFLSRLSKDWKSQQIKNVKYAVDNAVYYLKMSAIELFIDQMGSAYADGDPVKAEQVIANFTRVEKPTGEGVLLLRDAAAVSSAHIEEHELLFKFSGAFGKMVGNLNRGDFISFLAPMKRGKTYLLWYTAETAIHFELKVLFVTLEMTVNQMIRRGWQSLVGQAKNKTKVEMPYFEQEEDTNKYVVRMKKEKREAVDPSKIGEIQKKFKRRFRKGDIRVEYFPSYSVSVEDIEAHLDNLEYYDNFIPDVVVVDYADLIAPSRTFRGDYRHQLDDVWKKLRRIAQQRNLLMVTASQSDRSTFSTDVNEASVAEDIRKLAHVTHMIGLNQKKEEKERGILRVGQVAIREGKQLLDQVVLLQCLDIGRPVVDSKFLKEVDLELESDKKKSKKRNTRKR